MTLNQFGEYYFITLHGIEDHGAPPRVPASQCEVVHRPGFTGSAVIALGEKGMPFQMRSVVDAATYQDALAMGMRHVKERGRGPYGLIWNDIDFVAAYKTVYVPLEVELIKVHRLETAVGGLYPPSGALVETLWTLLPLAVPEPDA
jgi:hypothetical protein